jgi:hypothetical protein
MEMTEGGTPRYATFSIKKGNTEQIVTPANVPGFSNINIKWTPATTALENVEAAKLFTVFPNPAKTSIYVSGFGIREMQLFNLSGECVLKSIYPHFNISNLHNGVYLLKIVSQDGVFSKQIIKD